MFAGHDTTTSTVAFLFHELARNPELADDPSFDLGLAIDETLRLYPPAWIGPRRSIEPFAFGGTAAARRRAGQLLLVGQPPPARRVARARRLPARALRPGQPRADPQGRLRPLRRRLAHVHRDALRPGRGGRHRRGDPRALPPRARARLSARRRARCRPSAPSTGCRWCRVRPRAGRSSPSPPWPRERYLPTFTVSTPEPSPLERKSPAHWATKRLLPFRTRQLVV